MHLFLQVPPKAHGRFQGEILTAHSGTSPRPEALVLKIKHQPENTAVPFKIISQLKTSSCFYSPASFLSSGFKEPFQTQLQADLLGWINALKAVGKASDLEVVVLNAEKGKFLKLSMIRR